MQLALFASVTLGLLYFLVGLAFSVAGGYRRLRREARSEVGSRQEILGRLFDVEALLARQDPTRLTGDQQVWYARLRRHPTTFYATLWAGLAVGLLDVGAQALVFRITGRPLLSETPEASLAMLIYALAAIPFTLGGYTLVAFLAGSFGRGILMSLLFYYVHAACYALPIEPLGPDAWRLLMSLDRQWPGVIMVLVCTVIGVLGAQFEALLTQRNRRQGRSPAALLAERVMLQRRLNLGRQATCVLVVDVARSTKMKDGADPLKVEWSFREYQALVATVGSANGGEVLSTAGDGAVLLFARARDAVQAARRIQTEIGAFNQRRNRMSQPFRLRIGLHLGETNSDLAQAPFHEVIDKAAHIESVAPIGGIALSGRVAAEVPELQVVALANRIDDEEVMVVLNPTLDPDAE
jgi:class 3 adenylate cyclase